MWRLGVCNHCGLIPVSFLFLFSATCFCSAQTGDVLCRAGSGSFAAEFQGIRIHVGAAKSGGLATRSCEATLIWGEWNLVVATGASEIDLDAFGGDFGIALPVAAFQIRQSDSDCCRSYKIYALAKPPRLLRTINGGASFRAADTDLDGRAEIWTDDAAAIEGFENFSLSELYFSPPVILRFEHRQLLDVGTEFQLYFDQKIADVRQRLDPQDLKEFKDSDGQLSFTQAGSPERMHRLRKVKIGILEIVWSYLYSGRHQKAWNALAELWPGTDLERIQTALLKAHDRGMQTQVDGIGAIVTRRKKRAMIFDVRKGERATPEVVPPQPILLRRPPPQEGEFGSATGEIFLDLLLDSAGKVRSAEVASDSKAIDPGLISAAMEWKFIPAFSGGRPVASRTRLAISMKR